MLLRLSASCLTVSDCMRVWTCRSARQPGSRNSDIADMSVNRSHVAANLTPYLQVACVHGSTAAPACRAIAGLLNQLCLSQRKSCA